MNSIIRNVCELEANERSAIEHLVGHRLGENQQLVIQVMDLEAQLSTAPPVPNTLPDWCHVYEGLTEDEVAEVERTVLKRSDWTRSSE